MRPDCELVTVDLLWFGRDWLADWWEDLLWRGATLNATTGPVHVVAVIDGLVYDCSRKAGCRTFRLAALPTEPCRRAGIPMRRADLDVSWWGRRQPFTLARSIAEVLVWRGVPSPACVNCVTAVCRLIGLRPAGTPMDLWRVIERMARHGRR